MDSQLLSELTILFLLLLASARIFFKHSERKDPLSIVPFVALVCAVLNLAAWGIRFQELLIAGLSFWVFIWNFRALLRLNQSLIIDRHSVLFILISSVNCVLTLLIIAFTVSFRPVTLNLAKEGVEKQTTRYCGNMADGFTESNAAAAGTPGAMLETLKEQKSLDLIRYRSAGAVPDTPGTTDTAAAPDTPAPRPLPQKGTIVFLPAECASVSMYEPFLSKLARDGYTVYSADFFTPDVLLHADVPFPRETKRFLFVRGRLAASAEYQAWCDEKKEASFISMYGALEAFIPADEKLIIVGDGLPKNLYTSLLWKNSRFARCFDIANISDYTTPGWGPVEQTDPLLAFILGFSRDGARYTSNRIASVLEQTIEAGQAE